MGALLLFAQEEVGSIEGWLRIADERVVARGAGTETLPAPGADDALYLLLSGSEVTLRWLEIAALTEAQALGAARVALADISLGGADALHIVIGPAHGGRRLVAAIARERIAAWIAWGGAIGIEPDHIVPLPLLIAYGEGPARVWARADRTLVHGPSQAFAIEPGLLDLVMEDSPREMIDDATFEAELPLALAALPLDLRQGLYRRRREWRVEAGWRTRMLRYAAAAAILLLLIPFARLGRIAYDGHAMRQEAARVAQNTLGLPEPPEDARAILQQRVERLEGPGMGFADGSAALFGAMRQTPNVQLANLDFDESGAIVADIVATNPADLAELVRRIGSSGLMVETGGGSGAGVSRLTVRRP